MLGKQSEDSEMPFQGATTNMLTNEPTKHLIWIFLNTDLDDKDPLNGEVMLGHKT